MSRILLVLLGAFVLTSCSLISPGSSSATRGPVIELFDLHGAWRVILHYEVIETVHIEVELVIDGMDCGGTLCKLSGFVQSEERGGFERLPFDLAELHLESKLGRIMYHYNTIHGFTRRAFLFIDEFDVTTSPERTMAGHFVIYGSEAPASFFDSNDAAILAESRKGKAVHAGQLTAWRRD